MTLLRFGIHDPRSLMSRVAMLGAVLLIGLSVGLGTAHATVVGTISFGTHYKTVNGDFKIVGATHSFGPGQPVAYVAYIPGGAGTKHMTVAFFSQSNGKTTEVSHHPWNVTNIHDTEFANRYTKSDMNEYGIIRPGTYIMRFYRGKVLLAQGTFYRHA
jgi:hypothetical protein